MRYVDAAEQVVRQNGFQPTMPYGALGNVVPAFNNNRVRYTISSYELPQMSWKTLPHTQQLGASQ